MVTRGSPKPLLRVRVLLPLPEWNANLDTKVSVFLCIEKPCPIRLFALCRVKTPLALLSRVGARGVFFRFSRFPGYWLGARSNGSFLLQYHFVNSTYHRQNNKVFIRQKAFQSAIIVWWHFGNMHHDMISCWICSFQFFQSFPYS